MKTLNFVLILIALSTQACSYFDPEEITIKNDVVVDKKTIKSIKTPRVLNRTKNIAGVYFYPIDNWLHHEGAIKLENGELVTLKVAIVTTKNNTIYTNSYGQSGNAFYGNFSDLPKKEKIKEIIVESSGTIKFKKISWYCYNPL